MPDELTPQEILAAPVASAGATPLDLLRVGMDEPVPNYPTCIIHSTLNQPNAFVVPTGGALQQESSA